MGAVEILIVYENLDIMRYVLHCQGTEGKKEENTVAVYYISCVQEAQLDRNIKLHRV